MEFAPRILLPRLKQALRPNRVTALLGPRRVGKTVLLRKWAGEADQPYHFWNGEDLAVREALARREKVADVLARMAGPPVFQKLNEGDPWRMGEHLGISEAAAKARTRELQNICLCCDDFFREHMQAFNPDTFVELPVVGK